MNENSSVKLRVGIFIVVSLVIFVVFLFVFGAHESIFSKRYEVETRFPNTAGLIEGAIVSLSGVKIGSVSGIRFPEEPGEDYIRVVMSVSKEGMKRIGPDAKATIRTEGLLGDKYIEIIKGKLVPTPNRPEVMVIPSHTYPEFDELLGQSEELLENIIGISEGLSEFLAVFRKEENIENINKTIASLSKSLEEIENGDGILHFLIYGGTKDGAKPSDNMVSELSSLIRAVRSGNGLLHSLVYDQGLKDDMTLTFAQLGGDDGIAVELKKTVKNLRKISEKLEGGEGTLGALLNDPELYDSLKGIMGEAERSKFIRTAVRYMIEKQRDSRTD
ncbi:MAG: MlaD family protein [Thermodesulfobacteriota bacterium]